MPSFFKYSPDQIITQCNRLDLSQLTERKNFVYSGYLNIDKNLKSGLAFTFYGSQKAQKEEDIKNFPTIIWLQGGPGSSSQIGSFLLIGPQILRKNGTIKENKHTWNKEYNLLFVDQPIGTGFSYAENAEKIPKNQDEVAEQFVYALKELYFGQQGCFQQLSISGKTSPLFIFGESYAGKYIPSISQYIMQQGNQFNLTGVGMGDGFTDPIAISRKYPEFLQELGLLDQNQKYQLDQVWNQINYEFEEGDFQRAGNLFNQYVGQIEYKTSIKDIYNYRNDKAFSTKMFEDFIDSVQVKKALKFDLQLSFGQQSQEVYSSLLKYDFMQRDCIERLEEILNLNLSVLIYQGQNDVIVCSLCQEEWINKLNFRDIDSFRKEEFQNWYVHDHVAGKHKQAGFLEYKLVYNAGHMVPYDQPESAFKLAKDFINKAMLKKNNNTINLIQK